MERKKQNNIIEMNSNNSSNINKKIFNNMKYKKNALEQSYNKEHSKVNNKVKNNQMNNLNSKNNKSVNYRPNNERSSNNNKSNNNGLYNNKLEKYNKNTINKDYNNNKYTIDYNESIKKARNSSAPSLKQKGNENQNIFKSNKHHDSSKIKKDNVSLFHNNKIIIYKKDKKGNDNMLNDHQKYLKEKEKQTIKNKIYDISHRINNIKQNYNIKNNKRNFQNNLNNHKSIKKNYINDTSKNNTNNKVKIKQKKSFKNNEGNLEINLNIFKNILEKQEKILMMKKKLKNDKENISSRNRRDIPGFTSYNKSFQNEQSKSKNKKNQHNKSYDNSLNNPIHNEINNKESENNDIEIDNEEKVLNINEDNFNNDISNDISNDYNKNKKINRTFQNNLYDIEKEEKKEINSEERSKNEKINTIEMDTINNKNIVNTNFNLYNQTKLNKKQENNRKKDKKIRIINVPKYNDYYFTKSSNIINIINNNNININNKLNKTIFEKSNKSKIKENNINKSKFNESYEIKKSNIAPTKRKKIKNDLYNNTAINNNIQKNREIKKKPINSSKIKKHNVKIKIQTPKIRENKSDNKLKIKKIEQIGCICKPGEISYGKQKINQDNYFNYSLNTDDLIYIGVCDGHGDFGHFISDYLVKHLPKNFSNSYNDFIQYLEESHSSIPFEKMKKIFENSFLKTDSDLNNLCDNLNDLSVKEEIPLQNIFNCEYSGSTCISLLLPAIEDDEGNWTGPLRVWEKGSEGPGLAMTRSLGDKVGKKIGVCCTPEVTKYDIKEEDKVFVLASDGLWEYMSNQEVTDLVKNIYEEMKRKGEIDGDKMVKILYDKAVERWREKDVGMDDITIICIILN